MRTQKQAELSAGDSDMKFTDFGLPEILEQTLDECDLVTPTPIQKMAIPVLLDGRDLIGMAQTGTGKTAAFLLPMLARLSERDGVRKGQPPRALILAPTRELAQQVQENVRILTAHMNLRNISIYGGARYDGQINGLRRGVDIVIATPGRLEDLIAKQAISLEAIEFFILDEADHMLDLGFSPAVTRISALLPETRQTMLFSATMPAEIRKLCEQFLRDPVSVKAPDSEQSAKHIFQQVRLVSEDRKREQLAELLGSNQIRSCVIFVRTKRRADQLAANMSKQGFKIDALHGDMKQFLRRKVLNKFKAGEITALIATDVAARGIDIPAISHVINFDLPDIGEAYIHRIGRTGRAGLSGTAISFCSDSETDRLKMILKIIGKRDGKIEIVNEDGTPAELSDVAAGSHRRGRPKFAKQGYKKRDGRPSAGQRKPRRQKPEDGQARKPS
jgi:ATP-dependent RNA helicase RhlE